MSIGNLFSKPSGFRNQGFLDPAGIFNAPKLIDPPKPLPPPVTRNDQAVKDARTDEIKKTKNKGGRKSTILTSGRGVSDDQLGVTRPEATATLGGI